MATHTLIAAPRSTEPQVSAGPRDAANGRSRWLLLALFLAIYVATLWTPALLDDADATHASAALHIAQSGDWVTLKVNGVRYLDEGSGHAAGAPAP